MKDTRGGRYIGKDIVMHFLLMHFCSGCPKVHHYLFPSSVGHIENIKRIESERDKIARNVEISVEYITDGSDRELLKLSEKITNESGSIISGVLAKVQKESVEGLDEALNKIDIKILSV